MIKYSGLLYDAALSKLSVGYGHSDFVGRKLFIPYSMTSSKSLNVPVWTNDYQQKGKDMARITLAVNNLVSDLGGMLCDGAKGGCALKVVSSTDSAIRAAYMALNDHGITEEEGFVGKTAEETIQHLSRISERGMAGVDNTMLEIMKGKST